MRPTAETMIERARRRQDAVPLAVTFDRFATEGGVETRRVVRLR